MSRVIRTLAVSCFTAFVVAAGAACAMSPAAPTNFAPFSQTDLTVGTGATATSGVLVGVNFTGWLYDSSQPNNKGAVFSTNDGGSPLTFTLGAGSVIEGWDQGLVGMRVNGVRRLVVPPSLAYGQKRHGSIPPNSTLIFEVTLVSVTAQ